jgi:GT2 family glycosyltransferase
MDAEGLPRLAVLIPAFNGARTIGETLSALQANSRFDAVQMVALVDDCSSDATIAQARSHWHSSTPLSVWRNEANLGQWPSTNEGLQRLAQSTDWTFILHADDVVKPHWLSLYIEQLPRLPASVASICSSYDCWWPSTGKTEPGEDSLDVSAVHILGQHAEVISTLDRGCWWHISGCAIRNQHFAAIGGFAPEFPHMGDWDWLLRCLQKGYGVWYIPRTTMLYRQHEGAVSSRSFSEAQDIRDRLQILKACADSGIITASDHRARVRATLRHLARRAAVRLARRDWTSFRSHMRLVADCIAA